MVDAWHGFAVLVVAGGVECLVGQDLAGGGIDDGDGAVDDLQFHGPAGVLPADVDGAPPARDAFLHDAAVPADPVEPGGDGDVDAHGFRPLRDGDRPAAPGSPAGVPFVRGPRLLVAPGLLARGDLGVGTGLAFRLVGLPGRAPVQGAVGALLVVLASELVELGVERFEVARQRPGREPLFQRAVPSFDLALGLGMVGPAVLPPHAHQGEQALERARFGRMEPGRVHAAVVGERGRRDPVRGARLAERRLDRSHGHRGERMRVQEEAGVVVEPGDDERVRAVADRPVGEVRLPRLVRQCGLEPCIRRLRPLARLGFDQARVFEYPVDRGVRRRFDALALQPGGDGLRARVQTPGLQLTADRDDPFGQTLVGPVRDPVRAPGTRQKTGFALALPPTLQLMRPLARHPVAAGGLRYRHARENHADDGLVAQELAANVPAVLEG